MKKEKEDLSKSIELMRGEMAEMQAKLEDLARLIKVSHVINSTLDLDNLLNTIMEIAKEVMRAEASSLMLLNQEKDELVFKVALGEKGKEIKEKLRLKVGQGIAGWVAEHEKPVVVPDVEKDPRHYRRADTMTGFKTRSLICVPLKANEETIGVIEAMNPLNKASFEEADIDIFTAFANQAAVAIENARLHRSMLEKQKVEQELSIARNIQQSLLPKRIPHLDRVSFGAINEPARSIGGDLYDIFPLSDARIGVAIGDVAGKGIPAALFMVKGMSDFRFHVTGDTLCCQVLNKVNKALEDNTLGIFITMLYCVIDTRQMALEYANAGHCQPVLIKNADRSTTLLQGARNLPLGVMSDREYQYEKVPLDPGDTVFLYTDGVTEARDPSGEEFGIERLCEVLKETDRYPEGLVEAVKKTVDEFAHGMPQHDDFTAVALRID
jgi:sigma-B regulation protein RsbU (phosphoserine phosphatase)